MKMRPFKAITIPHLDLQHLETLKKNDILQQYHTKYMYYKYKYRLLHQKLQKEENTKLHENNLHNEDTDSGSESEISFTLEPKLKEKNVKSKVVDDPKALQDTCTYTEGGDLIEFSDNSYKSTIDSFFPSNISFGWSNIDEKDAKNAIEEYLSMSNIDTEKIQNPKFIDEHFRYFLTFFNSTFAPHYKLPNNSVNIDMFTKMIDILKNEKNEKDE